MKKLLTFLCILAVLSMVLVGCSNDADVASSNLSRQADNFQVQRRIIFYNGITDTYILSIEGACSLSDQGHQLEVTCKTGDGEFKKHFLGLSDNVTYFAEQLAPLPVSVYRYEVTFKPTSIIPNIELE